LSRFALRVAAGGAGPRVFCRCCCASLLIGDAAAWAKGNVPLLVLACVAAGGDSSGRPPPRASLPPRLWCWTSATPTPRPVW